MRPLSVGSISHPSLGTKSLTSRSNPTGSDPFLDRIIKGKKFRPRGQWLLEGRMRKITIALLMTVWNIWFQSVVLISVIFKFSMHLLLGYYLDGHWVFLDIILALCEVIYFVDVFIHLLHAFWPLVRTNVRVYRRSYFFLFYDFLSLILGFWMSFMRKEDNSHTSNMMFRWSGIGRIYRLYVFFLEINDHMRHSRKVLFFVQQTMTTGLILHASTCIWYSLHVPPPLEHPWGNLSYPPQVSSRKLKFDNYSACFYYCTCRFFNVIFGDAFPTRTCSMLLTSILMLFGYVVFRYRFIGILSWELVNETARKSNYVEKYHHMIKYLTINKAPSELVDLCKNYKLQLWKMKDGGLKSDQLRHLPLTLQMELIFDINVGSFHSSLLFRDSTEPFMRQISLLMHHELYLAGQQIWNQGVVKSGFIFVKRGVIEMLSDEDDESPMIAFKEGTVLGELSMFYSIPSKVTIKAATYVELQVLRRTDFMRVISEHPVALYKLRRTIYKRLRDARSKQEAIENYDKDDSRLIRTRFRPMKILKDSLAGVEPEDPTFIDDSHLYYMDENNQKQLRFTTEYLDLYKISNNVTTIVSPHICLRSNFPWILLPDTNFTHMMDIIHFILVLYVCFMSPYMVIQNEHSDPDIVLNTVVICGLLFNIYIDLTTAIVNKKGRKETLKDIVEEKMSTIGFYLDILSVFPVHVFTNTLDPSGESMAGQIANLFPVLQVWHIWAYFDKWSTYFDCNEKLIQVTKFCLLFIIASYWSGCILYVYACPKNLCQENSWMSQLIYWETKIFMTYHARHETPLKSSFAFGTAIFTGAGSSEFAPGNSDLYLAVFLFIFGSYLTCFYTARISCTYLLSSQRRIKFKESMRELLYFLSVNHVSNKIKARVKNFFSVQWYFNNAVSTEEIFENMSINTQQEVLAIEMVETLQMCPLFQECNRDFLQTVASNTRKLVLPDNEVIQHASDIGREMYILQKGYCNMLSHDGKKHASIGPGSHFGIMEMLFGLPKVYTIITSTNCILLHIDYSTFVQCWSTFPDISHPVYMALEDPEVKSLAAQFEEAKPLTGRIDAKTNRIAQEIKESFVFLSTTGAHREHYINTFDHLGVLRFLRVIFIPGCITPYGLFLKIWCLIRFVVALYYVVMIPYNIASKQHTHGGSYMWADIFLYMDIVVMSYVAYYNKKSLLVTHPLFTASRYFKHSFLWDLLSVFPFEILVKFINEKRDLDIFRINRVFLVTRITGAFSYWESDIMRVNVIVVLLKYLPIAVTIVNLATSFIFVQACTTFLSEDSQYVLANCTKVLILSPYTETSTYAVAEYAGTFYWVYEIFVGMGCTPVGMPNYVDLWIVMGLQITGFLYFAFMIGYVASTRSAAANSLLEHNEKTKDLENFLYQQNVEPSLTTKTLKYFAYVWKRTSGSNPQKICRRLNSALMEDTLVFMYERALREVPLFGKVERSFIRVITQHLHEMYFVRGDTVVQCKDVQPYIFIIYHGKVDVLSSYNEMITCMGPGGMFGNFSGQRISCSDVTIYASRSLDLLVIPSVTFFNLIKYYPKIQEPLNKAFENSRDYILPITMDNTEDDSSDESTFFSNSLGSMTDSKSENSRLESGNISTSTSQSELSQTKSATSTLTTHSLYYFPNVFTPGTRLHQIYGYTTCIMVTIHYVVGLYDLVTLNDCYLIFWLYGFLDIYFYFKCYFNIHESYISKHGTLIISGPKCRTQYFSNKLRFYSDILANFPTELLGFFFPKRVRAMHYLRVNKLLRLKYLSEFYSATSKELTNNLTYLQVVMTIIIIILVIHSSACLWLIIMVGTAPGTAIRDVKSHLTDEGQLHFHWNYVISFYMVICQLTVTGCDEFVIDDILPMVIIGFILVCGKMMAAIIVATSIQLAYTGKFGLTAYENATKELVDMLKNQGLSSYQLKKLKKYIQQLWVTERGRQLPALISQTPYVRRCDLMSAMFGHYLRSCYIFADTGEAFLRQLTVQLEFTTFFPGNYIVVAGDSEARMYWVASGTVAVVSVRSDLTEVTHESLIQGDVFGILQGIYKGNSHSFSYRAETKVNILTLSLDSWIDILPFFPEARRIISERSEVLFAQMY